jgi:nucleoside-diphosphate-sugar epimerase
MKIGIIGADGFIGSAIYENLKTQHLIANITREKYKMYFKIYFDIIINANGNSNKYWGNQNPLKDFDKSVKSVYHSIFDFKYNKYIYISSIDAEDKKTIYGYHKYLAEKIISFNCNDYSIIRLPAVIGKNAKKGIVYDILNYNKVYLTEDSTLMLMYINEFTGKLKEFIEQNKLRKIEKFYPSENITVNEIGKILGISVNYGNDLKKEYYNYNIYKGNYNTSTNYLKNMIQI